MKTKTALLASTTGACILFAALPGLTQEDHPLISRYEGSQLKDRKVEAFGEYKLVTGRTPQGELTGQPLHGMLTRILYINPPGRSTLEIYTNYRAALERAGATILYTCALEECGPAYARSAWNRYNGLFTASDGDPRYLAAKIAGSGGTAYVGLMVGKLRSQLDILELQSMEEEMVVADAAALAKALDREGRVRVNGIYFDTDKALIKPESKPALQEIAALLRERPGLNLYVVGHTDITGDFAHNRTLSEARARAVVAALVGDHGVQAGRLAGYGVGPLAPAASNATAAGRAKNRRVELVVR